MAFTQNHFDSRSGRAKHDYTVTGPLGTGSAEWVHFDPVINGLTTPGGDTFKGGRYQIVGNTLNLHATYYQGSNVGAVNGSGRYGFQLPLGLKSKLLTADDFGRIVGQAYAFVTNTHMTGTAIISADRRGIELMIGGFDGFNGIEWSFLNSNSHGFSGFESSGEVYFSVAVTVELE